MASLPAPSPDPNYNNPVNSALRTVNDRGTRDDDDIATPMALFNKAYDAAGGSVISIAAPIAGEKRPASPRKKSNTAAASSPVKKKNNTSSSPARNAVRAVARVAVATAAAIGVGGDNGTALPPSHERGDPSPTTVAGLAAPSAAPKKKYSSGPAMIGLVPKTQLLPWLRNPNTWNVKEQNVSPAKMKTGIQLRRNNMLYHFTKAGKTNNAQIEEDNDVSGPVTRSSMEEEYDWVIDLDAANCKVSDTRRLSRYMMEHIFTLPSKTTLLLLVSVDDNT